MSADAAPKVSIVLPTFNRARFLPQAFGSISSQTSTGWELLVVDDGSTDDTARAVSAFARECPRDVLYLKQSNQGPAAARNAGIHAARGELIAFYDSDDVWTDSHLERCSRALDANPDVHWTFGSFGRSRFGSREVVDSNVFYPNGNPAPFLSLSVSKRNDLKVIEDRRALECAIAHGIGASLKVSVVRRSVFDRLSIPDFRVGEDQALFPRAVANGVRFGYFDEVHGTAFIHDENVSTVAGTDSLDKSMRVLGELVRALESLRDLPLSRRERRALDRRVASEKFWNMGYACLRGGRMQEALQHMRSGLLLHPQNPRFLKTYLLAEARRALRIDIKGDAAGS